ncbi:MAG: phosphonate C-P lyase system protein PhnL [Alphaproteobacteria bacterium]|nr:phosphonate C-P lyase system protein PhnL [Alphaproteobacteria bacterium]
MTTRMLTISGLAKQFVLHLQASQRIDVFQNLDLTVDAGECVVLGGQSGSGKSTLMRAIYGNYKPTEGSIRIHHKGDPVELVGAEPHVILDVRRTTLGYVSQFLRVIPRVTTLDIVAEPLIALGTPEDEARERARILLARLNLPEALWSLPPATFSGGEQQRVNIARGFIRHYPVLLLDEPTASLDKANREVVIALINEAKARGSALVGIFHDQEVRDAVGTRTFDVTQYKEAA